MQQDERVFQLNSHLVRIGDEVRREIAAVELHAFDDIEFGFEGFCFLDCDDAFIADLFHGLGNHVADFLVAIGGDRTDLRNLGVLFHLARMMREVRGHFEDGLVDTALQVHRVHAGGNALHAFANDGLGENRSGRGAVAGNVVRLGGDFAQHLGAHILELVLKLDLFCDGDTIFRGARGAEGFLDDDVAAFRAERHFYSVCERIDAFEHALTSVSAEFYVFCSHVAVFLLKFGFRVLRIERLTSRSRRECRSPS